VTTSSDDARYPTYVNGEERSESAVKKIPLKDPESVD